MLQRYVPSPQHSFVHRCLMDTKPRKMTEEDYRVLNSCAEMVCCPACLALCMICWEC